MANPYLFLDIDEVLQASHMAYGFERTSMIREKIPVELVHPALRPQRLYGSGQELPDWAGARPSARTHIPFRTPVRTSVKLRADIAELGVDVLMLTSWLEHDSVDAFFEQSGGAQFAYRKLRHPGRPFDDPLGALPQRWKLDELIRVLEEHPRPFIWADDDEVPAWRDEVAARFPDIPKLLLAPLRDLGLTRNHVAQMREFVAAARP